MGVLPLSWPLAIISPEEYLIISLLLFRNFFKTVGNYCIEILEENFNIFDENATLLPSSRVQVALH